MSTEFKTLAPVAYTIRTVYSPILPIYVDPPGFDHMAVLREEAVAAGVPNLLFDTPEACQVVVEAMLSRLRLAWEKHEHRN